MNRPTTLQRMKQSNGFQIFAWYTLSFPVIAFAVFFCFFIGGKSFIWHQDGLYQHYMALAYYGRWLREIFYNIFVSHTFAIPVWDLSIGFGSDIITTMHYYCLGDPLCLLSALIPGSKTEYFYDFLILLRFYLAGGGFILFCRYFHKTSKITILGAYLYIFSTYMLVAGIKHPYFLTPAVYMPLILLGAEKIFDRKNPAIFILAVCGMTLSNFYFAYMVILLTVLYAAIRFLTQKHAHFLRELGFYFARFLLFGGIAVAMSCVVFLPVLIAFLSADRANITYEIGLFYPLRYYDLFISNFLGYRELGWWEFTGYSALCLISVIFLFVRRKQYRTLKVMLIASLILQIFPVCGHILNGFSYVTNRYLWIFSFLLAFIAVYVFDDLLHASAKEKRTVFFWCVGYVVLCVALKYGKDYTDGMQFGIFGLILFGILAGTTVFSSQKAVRKLICGLCLLSVAMNAALCFAPKNENYISEFIDRGTAWKKVSATVSNQIDELKSYPDFYRFEHAYDGHRNQSILNGSYGVAYYFSLSGDHLAQYIRELEMNVYTPYDYWDMNHQAFPDALASVRYYAGTSHHNLPYPFEFVGDKGSFSLFENQEALPLGYTYDSFLTRQTYEKLNPVQKQEALMQSVLLESPVSDYQQADYALTSLDIPYTVEVPSHAVLTDHGLLVTKNHTKLTLNFEGAERAETYLSFSGLQVQPMDAVDLRLYEEQQQGKEPGKKLRLKKLWNDLYERDVRYFPIVAEGNITSEKISLSTPSYQYYNGTHDFTVHLGYGEQAQNRITIDFPSAGLYTWDQLQILCQPMENYALYTGRLREAVLENVEILTNRFRGTIDLEDNRILCLSIPYSDGWTAYVDGSRAELLQANTWEMALDLEPGRHVIELRYRTPGLALGGGITVVGILGFVGVLLTYRKRAHRKNQLPPSDPEKNKTTSL